MSLYSNFTLKEWLCLNCTTKEVDNFFCDALKNKDEPMSVLAMAELIKRGYSDLVAFGIVGAVDSGCFVEKHFSTVIQNALANLGNRDLSLRAIVLYVDMKGWPRNSKELAEVAMNACAGDTTGVNS